MLRTLMVMAISFSIISCSSTKKAVNNKNLTHSSQNALDWGGNYRGILPCADCDGIQTTLQLNTNLHYTLKTVYLGKEAKPFEEAGTFAWTKEGNKITLKPTGNNPSSMYLVGENTVTRLDSKGNLVSGALAEDYVLTKAAFAIYERYWKLVNLNGESVKVDDSFKSEPHVIFKNKDNKIYGSGGCNRMFGSFKLLSNNHIKISQVGATMMACPNLKLEDAFFKTLQNADSYTVQADNLTLLDKEGKTIAKFKSVVM